MRYLCVVMRTGDGKRVREVCHVWGCGGKATKFRKFVGRSGEIPVDGRSMRMYCLDVVGRESWVWVLAQGDSGRGKNFPNKGCYPSSI